MKILITKDNFRKYLNKLVWRKSTDSVYTPGILLKENTFIPLDRCQFNSRMKVLERWTANIEDTQYYYDPLED